LKKSIGNILPIFFTTTVLVAVIVVITIAFSSLIVTVQAEFKEVSSIEKTELLLSSNITTTTATKDKDISYKSIIKHEEEEEKGIVNGNSTIYEGLGIKLENFTPWTVITKSDKSTCYKIDLCFLYLGIINRTEDVMPQVWILQDSVESQTIKEYCKCNTLDDYERHFYTNMISKFEKFSFINENETTFYLEDNIPAIQLEYEFSPNDTQIHTYTVFTKNNYSDSFYQFSYYADPEYFLNYLPDFKKIIDIVEFT
jgi:hypothetical protein